MRDREKPTTSRDGHETHPAYGMIGAFRVSASHGTALFGSDFLHQHYMTIRIAEGEANRTDTRDWFHARKEVIEVALSYAQWATFLSETNIGGGHPCTIQWRERDGDVPAIDLRIDRREKHRVTIDSRLQRALSLMDELAEDPALSKVRRDKAYHAAMEIRSNLPYIAERFDEEAEKTIEKAKIEVGAYIESAIRRAGVAALGAPAGPVLALPAEAGEENQS